MFRGGSWLRRAGTSIVLIAAVCAGSLGLPHDEGADDSACAPVFVSHDERAHYVGAAPSTGDADGQHCYLCHSLRSFSLFEKYEQRDSTRRAERLNVASVPSAGRLEWSVVRGRAPPA